MRNGSQSSAEETIPENLAAGQYLGRLLNKRGAVIFSSLTPFLYA